MQLFYPDTGSVVWLCRQQGDDLAEEIYSSTTKMGEGHSIVSQLSQLLQRSCMCETTGECSWVALL